MSRAALVALALMIWMGAAVPPYNGVMFVTLFSGLLFSSCPSFFPVSFFLPHVPRSLWALAVVIASLSLASNFGLGMCTGLLGVVGADIQLNCLQYVF